MLACPPVRFEIGTYVGEKVKQLIFDGIIASETTFKPGMSSEWHYHSHPHFSHILSGGSRELREKGTQIQMAGTSLYYYPGIPHQNLNYVQGTRIFNMELTADFFKNYDILIPDESFMFEAQPSINTACLMQIMREIYLNDADTPLSLQQLCLTLNGKSNKREHLFPEWTKKIKSILYDEWDKPLSLHTLAHYLQVHPVTISRYFARYFGCTAGEYLRQIKVEKALILLKSQHATLTEVAYRCGFSDQAHFTKIFKKLTGFTPNQYRKL